VYLCIFFAGNIEKKRIEDAFQVIYQGSALNTFYDRLTFFHKKWRNGDKSYAPYLTIIQSSGSGKTRLVGELRTKGIHVLYICKRQRNSSGYPRSTPYVEAIKLIKSKNWSEEEFWNFQIKVEYEGVRTQFWKSVLESVDMLSSDSQQGRGFIKNLFNKEAEISVVCCIDEAHELLEEISDSEETYFVRWRRQIRDIKWYGFFNILLSTNGKIGKFLPPEIRDTRSARMHQYNLLPAYLDVHTIDALARIAQPGNNYNPQRALYLGIPLWGSLAQVGADLIDITKVAG